MSEPDKLDVLLPFPPSANHRNIHFVKNGRPVQKRSDRTNAFHRHVAIVAKQVFRTPFSGGVGVSMRAWFPTRRGDIDNIVKATLDALEGIAYLNDRQIVELHVFRDPEPCKNNPRIHFQCWEV